MGPPSLELIFDNFNQGDRQCRTALEGCDSLTAVSIVTSAPLAAQPVESLSRRRSDCGVSTP